MLPLLNYLLMSCINLLVSAIQHYSMVDVDSCLECIEKHFSVYNFTVLKKCCTEYEQNSKSFSDKK